MLVKNLSDTDFPIGSILRVAFVEEQDGEDTLYFITKEDIPHDYPYEYAPCILERHCVVVRFDTYSKLL